MFQKVFILDSGFRKIKKIKNKNNNFYKQIYITKQVDEIKPIYVGIEEWS